MIFTISVATALTVYGIETIMYDKIKVLLNRLSCNGTYRLRYWNLMFWTRIHILDARCNGTYRLRYWNLEYYSFSPPLLLSSSCNGTYRLRYWNYSLRVQVFLDIWVATALTVYGIETNIIFTQLLQIHIVATALTVYGIETEVEYQLLC